MHLKDSLIGWASDMHVQCGSDPCHTFPLTKEKKVWKNNKKSKMKNRRRSMDYDDNVMGILAPFLTGTGTTEVTDMGCMLNLPSGKSFRQTSHRNQPLICKQIISTSEEQMSISMAEEIKATIINERSEELYEDWIKLPVDQREKFGLVVSYDMGWQKRASGHSYSSRSGHAFVIGMYTKQIIDCVVYSMNCKKCEYKPKDDKGGDDNEKDQENKVEESESDESTWNSSFSRMKSN